MTPDTPLSVEQPQSLERSRQATLAALVQVDDNSIRQLTRLSLPEIQSVQQEIANVFPAGNLPAFVLSGLLKLKGRRPNPERMRQDITTLLHGASLIPEGLYGVFVAGPAVALYAYQKLLQLAGIMDPDSAFPQGAWQFYLQFSLREDSARHANETVGFQRALPPSADPATTAAAWVCAGLEILYRYDDLLAADWTERAALRLLTEEATEAGVAGLAPFAGLVRDWKQVCPYHRPPGAPDYILHRQATFRHFLQERLGALPRGAQDRFTQRYRVRLADELPDYQEQLTLLASLEPDRYQEYRQPVPLWKAAIAFVWKGQTYLLSACQHDEQGAPLCYPAHSEAASPFSLRVTADEKLYDPAGQPLLADRAGQVWHQDSGRLVGSLHPPAPDIVLGYLTAILSSSPLSSPLSSDEGTPSTLDLLLAESPRHLQQQLRGKLPAAAQAELAALRCAPIIVNWDRHPYGLPLAYIRRGRRGIGDHALTLFRTERSIVFDQSHIFFDGVWGLAVAEIFTDSALHWYHRLADMAPAPQTSSPVPLTLSSTPAMEALAQPHRGRSEVAVESMAVDTHRLFRLRRWLQERGVQLTVNDLLLLYRSLYAAWYRSSVPLQQALDAFSSRATSPEAKAAYQAIETTLARTREANPVLLIPMDASHVSPKERVFPTSFSNPLTEIPDLFKVTQERHQAYHGHSDLAHWSAFDHARRELMAYLAAFGEVLDALKALTMRGESFNSATLRLLAHLPASLQHLLDQVPQRISVLNEIIKGSEVFSNVGRVAPGTSLTRFISAKDDGQTKELIWGVLTDDQGRMCVTLRDFRPFVPQLLALGEGDLATLLAQDYLDGYVRGLNAFVAELSTLIALKGPFGS
jgi:hypothetical protein